jgi:hypothetical protein
MAKDWIPCLHCQRGPKGEKSCSSGLNARSLKLGCFMGQYLPGKEPKTGNEKRG